uniref:Uncharacterized protein n=1 Tax=viral metagenome TaxID=1070528 RepID=A0A6H2A305_9ZZZZ
MYVRDIECPWCKAHENIQVYAIIIGAGHGPEATPDAVLEFVCEGCRRSFKEKDITLDRV